MSITKYFLIINNSDNTYSKTKPINVKECDFKQSKYDVAPRLPFSQIITGPSGSGKGILLQSMILDIYRDVFERTYIWSPSISVYSPS